MTNKDISSLLREIAASYTIKNEAKFRFQIIAYQNAAEAIEGLSVQVKDLYDEGELDSIPGVGNTIKQRLEELLKTGEVKHFEEVKKGIPPAVFTLMQIPGFGPKKAFRLSTHFKLSNPDTAIEELKKFAEKGEVAVLEGFGEKSQADIIRSIDEFKKGKGKTTKMLLPYAHDIATDVLNYLKENEYVERAEALGSLRRMKPLVGDVDIAVASKNPEEVIEHFIKYPRKDRIIEKGPATSSLLTTGGSQVDLMVQPPELFGSLLQHFTGSKAHNVHLREYALKKNMSLSERGIKDTKTGKLSKFKSEEEFYSAIGLTFVPPEMREDTGEIELALKNKLPKIIELKDIKGEFHVHSGFPIEPSHDLGKNTIEEMIEKAKKLGYKFLGFSEHNPSISKHNQAQITELVRRRNDEIEKVSDKLKFKTFKMMETDILPDGNLALPEKALELLDASVVSIHSVFKMDREEMTGRIIKGLSHPKAKILAHPTGRLLNERNGYEVDFDRLFEFCKKNNKFLEINAYPNRLDLGDSLIRKAVEAKVKMVINTDSHADYQMENMIYGLSQARRGWATKDDILNTLSYNDIRKIFNKD
jgi:DNA polymerase (family X)